MAFPADPPRRGDDEGSGLRLAPRRDPHERPSWAELVSLVRCQVRSLVGPSPDLEDLSQATLDVESVNPDGTVSLLPKSTTRAARLRLTYPF